jgi:hypothetical protein
MSSAFEWYQKHNKGPHGLASLSVIAKKIKYKYKCQFEFINAKQIKSNAIS